VTRPASEGDGAYPLTSSAMSCPSGS